MRYPVPRAGLAYALLWLTCPGLRAGATAEQTSERSADIFPRPSWLLRAPAAVPNVKRDACGCGFLSAVAVAVGELARAPEAAGPARSADQGRAERGLNLLKEHITTEGCETRSMQ